MAPLIEENINPDFVPITGPNFSESHGRMFIFIEFWLVGILLYYINMPYYLGCQEDPYQYLIFPIWLYGLFFQFMGLSTIISAVYIRILWLIHPIKEGVFDIDGPEFRWYCRRYYAMFLPIYFARATPLPWVDMIVYRLFRLKMGKNICIYDGWVDNELISIGDSVMLSLNGSIMTHCIYKDKFIIKKVVIEKNSIIGADALIAPGVFVEEGAIVGASASTVIDQQLDGYVTHVGNPVSRKLPIKISEPQVETPNSE